MRTMLLLALAFLLAACSGPLEPAPLPPPLPTALPTAVAGATVPPTPTAAPLPTVTPAAAATTSARPTDAAGALLRIFADEALRGGFTELATAFRNLTPGLRVDLVFAPSASLIDRLRRGESADVAALAGDEALRQAIAAGLVEESQTVPIAEDRLALVAPRQAAAAGLEVLAQPGLHLALARADTLLGDAARTALERLVANPPEEWVGISPAPTLERLLGAARAYDDAQAIVAALQVGEADAAILYESALTPLIEAELRRSALPRGASQPLRYNIARLASAAHPDAAEQFIGLAASAAGQATLSAYNLYPIVSSASGPAPIPPTLEIAGAVEQPLALSVAQLAQRPRIEVTVQERSRSTSADTSLQSR